MNEIYWITRLDVINVFLTLIAVFSVIAAVVLFFIGIIKRNLSNARPPFYFYLKQYSIFRILKEINLKLKINYGKLEKNKHICWRCWPSICR